MPAPGGKRPTWIAALVAVAVVAIGAAAAIAIVGATGNGDDTGRQDGAGPGDGRGDGDNTLPPPGVVCTQIACFSDAQVRLGDLPPRARAARVCVAGRCGEATPVDGPAPTASAPVPEAKRRAGVVVRVTLELLDADGDAIRSAARRAEVVGVQPNGPKCPPICFQVHLRYDGDTDALTPAPPPF